MNLFKAKKSNQDKYLLPGHLKKLFSSDSQKIKIGNELEESVILEASQSVKGFSSMTPEDKNKNISDLGEKNIEKMEFRITPPILTVLFSQEIKEISACTGLQVIERLARISYAIEDFHIADAKSLLLLCIIPLSAKDSFAKWKNIIESLLPWVQVKTEFFTSMTPALEIPEKQPKQSLSLQYKYFADCENLTYSHYVLKRDDGGGWHAIYSDLVSDPFRHIYTLITDETVVHNSHGTDTDDYHTEKQLEAKEAIDQLIAYHPDAGKQLERYEQSCNDVYSFCAEVISRKMQCTPVELIYNSSDCTVLCVTNADGTSSAVKICLKQKADIKNTERLCQAISNDPDAKHVIRIEEQVILQENKDNTCIVAIRMPLLKNIYTIKTNNNNKYCYTSDNEKINHLSIATDIAKALSCIHKQGFVHHDVRPENFLIDHEGNVVLGDLDSVKPLFEQYKGHLKYSSLFAAPEILQHQPYGKNVDVYAWGRSFLYILTFFPLGHNKQTSVSLESNNEKKQSVLKQEKTMYYLYNENRILADVLVQAISVNPQNRYHDATELVKVLNKE